MSGIVFQNVTKYYASSESPAVNHVSLTVESGEFVVLLGSSGCGKTTLLKMVNRLYELSEGTILVGGNDNRAVPVNELRRQIGYVIQQSGLFPHMTVEQNVATVPEMLGWDKQKLNKRIDELLELVHLDPKIYRKRYPRQLSGGQQQRVGLARALAADPPYMLMDEPFGAIDTITRASLQDEMLQIQKKLHKTILFVTHDVDEALKLADKIVVMKDGQVIQFDTPLNIIASPKNDFVKELIGGDDLMRQLSLIPARQVMKDADQSMTNAVCGSIAEHVNLKEALALMLKTGNDCILVTDPSGNVAGYVSLKQIREIFS
ncbi:ABC transporter ATP-binding protein [Paenibacillus sp. 7124]|uniref:Carnitine transport ATP-binding protein OpuCA n=1 Tax=Paenibacillus apii TaxID=1850370 RepID=A0A6M1PJA8_9BACL|nr:ABC transporter ATP-binding protein [Paenibacillus apii]NGM82442.1 ABC transporter ATP-binding protein [Paenibacillus apii]NJJ39579.1 ABC transporter ATP-binding protein [Paenibacillus apii]